MALENTFFVFFLNFEVNLVHFNKFRDKMIGSFLHPLIKSDVFFGNHFEHFYSAHIFNVLFDGHVSANVSRKFRQFRVQYRARTVSPSWWIIRKAIYFTEILVHNIFSTTTSTKMSQSISQYILSCLHYLIIINRNKKIKAKWFALRIIYVQGSHAGSCSIACHISPSGDHQWRFHPKYIIFWKTETPCK